MNTNNRKYIIVSTECNDRELVSQVPIADGAYTSGAWVECAECENIHWCTKKQGNQ